MSDMPHDMSDEELESTLARLPRPAPPPELWDRIAARAAPPAARPRRSRPSYVGLALALAGMVAASSLVLGLYPRARRLSAPKRERPPIPRSSPEHPAQPPEPLVVAASPPTPGLPSAAQPEPPRPEREAPGPARESRGRAAAAPVASLPGPAPQPPAEPISVAPVQHALAGGPEAAEGEPADLVAERADEDDAPSYFAIVSRPDGTRSVLSHAAADRDPGEGRAIRLEYTTFPAPNRGPGAGG